MEQSRSEGRATMLDPPESSAFTRHVLGLFFPLRSRAEWGRPIPFSDIHDYLAMRGYEPSELFEWLCIADSEALSWMNEETARERDRLTAVQKSPTHARRSIRH